MTIPKTDLPIVGAPMAGGPTTVPLALAVAEAGGLPFLAGANKTPDALAAEIDTLIESGHPFGVNLFVLRDRPVNEPAFRGYAESLRPEAEKYGIDLESTPARNDDEWSAKLQLLIEREVPLVSLTFGLPDRDEIAALRQSGTSVAVSVTNPEEARLSKSAGADALVVQGLAAGGHSATFDPSRDPADIETVDLVRSVTAATELPVIAGGGVDGPAAVADLLEAGASAISVGTLLLRTEESGASQLHKDALADPRFEETALTRAFTGRPARSLRNEFVDRHDRQAPTGYPEVHLMTREFRVAAAKQGDRESVHLWAGTGYRNAAVEPAGALVRRLAGVG